MAAPGIPNSFLVQTGNRTNFISWDFSPGATSYTLYRSVDGINFILTSNAITDNNFTDDSVFVGTQYYYKVQAVNADGSSPFTSPQSVIPAPTGEMSLAQLRLMSQQRADRVNSNFVTTPEWNNFINLAQYELYDLIVTTYEDYFMATPYQFTVNGTSNLYPLPDGGTQYVNGITGDAGYLAPPFYKLKGVDLSLNQAGNAWVTINKFQFSDRNTFVYPNSASTIYGVFNMQYRMIGTNIEFIPTPSANQNIRVWYVPRLPTLLKDTDITTIGFSGWLDYVIVRAAKYALDKQESDTTKLDAELVFLKGRIEEAASNRDDAQPDTISRVRNNGSFNSGNGFGFNGGIAGF